MGPDPKFVLFGAFFVEGGRIKKIKMGGGPRLFKKKSLWCIVVECI